eukprot:4272-Heterococcus_DN1.PRE.2
MVMQRCYHDCCGLEHASKLSNEYKDSHAPTQSIMTVYMIAVCTAAILVPASVSQACITLQFASLVAASHMSKNNRCSQKQYGVIATILQCETVSLATLHYRALTYT